MTMNDIERIAAEDRKLLKEAKTATTVCIIGTLAMLICAVVMLLTD